MPDVDFNAYLAQKYAIMQQQANADTTRAGAGLLSAQAGAKLDTVRAGLLPGESAANVAQTRAQTQGLLEQNKYIGPLAQSTIGLQGSAAKQNLSQSALYGSQAEGENLINKSGGWLDLLQKLRQQQAG